MLCGHRCLKLIKRNPDIVQALENAVESGHYEQILSLPAQSEDQTTSDGAGQSHAHC